MDDNGYMVSVTGWEWIVDDLGTELYQENWGGGRMGRVPVLHPGSSGGRKGGVRIQESMGDNWQEPCLSALVYSRGIDLQKCFNLLTLH